MATQGSITAARPDWQTRVGSVAQPAQGAFRSGTDIGILILQTQADAGRPLGNDGRAHGLLPISGQRGGLQLQSTVNP